MSYAIGMLVYGINLQAGDYGRNDALKAVRAEIDELTDAEVISTAYSGNGEEPVYFGVALGSMSEGNEMSGVEIVTMCTPTPTHFDEYQAKLTAFMNDDSISKELRIIVAQAEPKVFLTWGSS
jgi:hypothetical protein